MFSFSSLKLCPNTILLKVSKKLCSFDIKKNWKVDRSVYLIGVEIKIIANKNNENIIYDIEKYINDIKNIVNKLSIQYIEYVDTINLLNSIINDLYLCKHLFDIKARNIQRREAFSDFDDVISKLSGI